MVGNLLGRRELISNDKLYESVDHDPVRIRADKREPDEGGKRTIILNWVRCDRPQGLTQNLRVLMYKSARYVIWREEGEQAEQVTRLRLFLARPADRYGPCSCHCSPVPARLP